MREIAGSNVLADTGRPFFYPASMLSADRKHGISSFGITEVIPHSCKSAICRSQGLVVSSQGLGSRSSNHDILCRARLQASSITKDGVLADLISEQILMHHGPSMNYIGDMKEKYGR